MQDFEKNVQTILALEFGSTIETADVKALYHAVSKAAMAQASPGGKKKRDKNGLVIFRRSFCSAGLFTAIC